MPVQTCTKGKPASVLQHLAGLVELCPGSIHSIHQHCADVKRFLPRICCLVSPLDLSTDLIALPCSSWFLSPPPSPRHPACDSKSGDGGRGPRPLKHVLLTFRFPLLFPPFSASPGVWLPAFPGCTAPRAKNEDHTITNL